MSNLERVYRAEGVVLRRRDFGEADRLTTIYTKNLGKLRLVAKGVRKPRSRKSGHLEPFTRVKLLIARGRNLDIITQAESIETYPNILSDLITLGHASYIVELLDRFSVEEREDNQELYNLLLSSLDRLSSAEEKPWAVTLFFELRLLEFAGYRPEFFECVHCAEKIEALDQYFSFQLGGVVCPRGRQSQIDSVSLSLLALKVLRFYQRNRYETAAQPRIESKIADEVGRLMESYLSHILEGRLNSPVFLRRVQRLEKWRV
ncbi:MAG: DNA repair protein RecO [Chloroflexi bacterium]|nr:DNA repair protein RecO [Chloroflexota bacterium]